MSVENSKRRGVDAVPLAAENEALIHEIAWEVAAIARALPSLAPSSGDTEDTPFLVRAMADRLARLSSALMSLLESPAKPAGELAREVLLVDGGR